MKHSKHLLLWGLVALFAVLMSVPFLVPHCGFVALFGIVPLLCMDRVATMTDTRRVWIYHYSAFVLWNTITTFWVCNATVGGGIFAVLYNSLQMSLVFGLFRLSKKKFTGVLPYVFLVAAWIAWERLYFNIAMSWPWLTLGNAFARSVASVQWYEFTGTLGGSLWIWMCNLAIFGIMVLLSDGRWTMLNIKAKIVAVCGLIALFVVPFVTSWVMFGKYEETENPLEVAIFQPNIDPYHKFEALTQEEQDEILIGQMSEVLAGHAEDSCRNVLLLAPETFITHPVYVGEWSASPTIRRFTSFLSDYPGVNLLVGAEARTLYYSEKRPSRLARQFRGGDGWWESHNSALMIDWTSRVEIFHKSKLVVGVESTPWPAVFCKIDEWLSSLLGVYGLIGRCVGQDEISLLHCVGADSSVINVGCAVCYESVYGEYCTGYVAKGADVLTVITNDAWWGNTPGYRQHLSYSSLRAIETRRSIARCANTGISAIIDQRGVIHNPSPWWQRTILEGSVNLNDKITFFVAHGDVAGRLCTFVFGLLCAALLVAFLRRR